MFYPKREGIDGSGAGGEGSLNYVGHDPMAVSLQLQHDTNAILRRIESALTNIAAENDAIIEVPPGKSDGTIKALMPPRFRVKWIFVAAVGTGKPILAIGSELVTLGEIGTPPVPYYFPYPRVIQEGVDIFAYNAAAPTNVPTFYVYLIGTTE